MTNPPAANEPPEQTAPLGSDAAPGDEALRYEADYADLPSAPETEPARSPDADPTPADPTPPAADPTPPAAEGPNPPPSGPPPGAGPGVPPPFAAPQPPPHEAWLGAPSASFGSRYGLVRPINGRYIAGVCAAIGRATNTDPVLWRVLLAVLTLFGGVGLLAYLVGWLLIPSEGDSVSALEAMLGRGQSGTPLPVVILVLVATIMIFAFVISDGLRPAVLGAAVIAGALALLFRNGQLGRVPGSVPPGTGPTPPMWGPTPAAGGAGAGTVGAADPYTAATANLAAQAPPTGPSGPAAPETLAAPEALAAPTAALPTVPPTPSGPPMPSVPPMPPMPPITRPLPANVPPAPTVVVPPMTFPPGYRPPFAPHGPYASSSPYAASLGYPTATAGQPPGSPPQYPGLSGSPAAPAPPPQPRSRLGRVIVFVICLLLGVLAVVDVAGADLRGTAYPALALATVGLGLVIGAWLGRARWLIPIGLILALALGIGTASESAVDRSGSGGFRAAPASVAEIRPNYQVDFGEAVLDLTRVDFTDRSVEVDVGVDAGSLTIILPPEVDVEVAARVDFGDAMVFDDNWGGIDQGSRTTTNNGVDGPGGGSLRINARVHFGNLEVDR